MEVRNLITTFTADGSSFAEVKRKLTESNLKLQVREDADLYNLMFSDDSPEESIVEQCVGVVLSKDTHQIVGYSMEKTKEIVISTDVANQIAAESLAKEISDPFEDLVFNIYEEGVKLTVYHHNQTWRISTTRVIDAGKAFWTSPISFKDQFMEACWASAPRIADQISRNSLEGELICGRSYVFILVSPHNKSLSDVRNPKLIHVATVDLHSLLPVSQPLDVAGPTVVKFRDWVEVAETVKRQNYWMPGFVVTSPNKRYKIFSQQYRHVKELGGNTPDMYRHYLEIRKCPQSREQFRTFYPKYRSLAAAAEKQLWKLARLLHSLYIMYYVRKQRRPLMDKTLFVTLMQIHETYRQTGQKRTVDKVYEHVNGLSPTLQCILLRLLQPESLAV